MKCMERVFHIFRNHRHAFLLMDNAANVNQVMVIWANHFTNTFPKFANYIYIFQKLFTSSKPCRNCICENRRYHRVIKQTNNLIVNMQTFQTLDMVNSFVSFLHLIFNMQVPFQIVLESDTQILIEICDFDITTINNYRRLIILILSEIKDHFFCFEHIQFKVIIIINTSIYQRMVTVFHDLDSSFLCIYTIKQF